MSGLVSGLVGIQTQAAQSSVFALDASAGTNVTGAGTTYTVDYDTEIFDQNGDFASDVFTAPVTGRYLVIASVGCAGVTAAGTVVDFHANASNRNTRLDFHNPANGRDANGEQIFCGSAIIDMDAADTLDIRFQISNESSDVVDISASSSDPRTFISVHLLA